MNSENPPAGMLTIEEAKEFLTRSIGSSPDSETITEWVQFGNLEGETRGEDVFISEDSLKNLIAQLDNRRPPRLALKAVDHWRRKLNHIAVAVTLASPDSVATAEHVCKKTDALIIESAVRATISAVGEILKSAPPIKFLRAKSHTFEELSVVTVLIEMGEGEDAMILSGIAEVRNAKPTEAAARAALHALNRNLSQYLRGNFWWRDLFKKIVN